MLRKCSLASLVLRALPLAVLGLGSVCLGCESEANARPEQSLSAAAYRQTDGPERAVPGTADELAAEIVHALEGTVETRTLAAVTTSTWSWVELALYDETYPLVIDIVASRRRPAQRIVYMLPGGATNFKNSYFTPRDANLTHYLRERGGLIIGITPREDSVPTDLPDYSFTADWGMRKHSEDIHSVVSRVRAVSGLPYEVLGHSFGSASALDYAARFPADDLRHVKLLDIYSLDPDDTETRAKALLTEQAHVQLLEQGVFVDDTFTGFPEALAQAVAHPDEDSGQSRETVGYGGNFTRESLIYATTIFASMVPGIHTPITGLAGDWQMVLGGLAGVYLPSADPRNDLYRLAFTPYERMSELAAVNGSALIPIAFTRDFCSVNASGASHTIDWAAISAHVTWINSELGYGPKTHGAELIRRAGNRHVDVHVIPLYAHGDLLWSDTARWTVWDKL